MAPRMQFGYKDFIPLFTADRFDAAGVGVASSARRVRSSSSRSPSITTASQMYDSALSPWNSMQKGPKRDIIGELAEAVRSQWMVFGVSSHRAEHWWFMNGGNAFPSDVQDPALASFYGPAQPKEMPPNDAVPGGLAPAHLRAR